MGDKRTLKARAFRFSVGVTLRGIAELRGVAILGGSGDWKKGIGTLTGAPAISTTDAVTGVGKSHRQRTKPRLHLNTSCKTVRGDVKSFVIRRAPEMHKQWAGERTSNQRGWFCAWHPRISQEKSQMDVSCPHRWISKTVMRPRSSGRKKHPRAEETEGTTCGWSERESIEV